MNGCYEIYFVSHRDSADEVEEYFRHYDFERIDPATRAESWFILYGKCEASELNDLMYGIVGQLQKYGIELNVRKYIWGKDE